MRVGGADGGTKNDEFVVLFFSDCARPSVSHSAAFNEGSCALFGYGRDAVAQHRHSAGQMHSVVRSVCFNRYTHTQHELLVHLVVGHFDSCA